MSDPFRQKLSSNSSLVRRRRHIAQARARQARHLGSDVMAVVSPILFLVKAATLQIGRVHRVVRP